MVDSDSIVSFALYLRGGPDDDGDDLERAAAAVRQEWIELDVLRVPPCEPSPEDTRGVDMVALGAITAAASFDAIPVALEVIMRWIRGRRGRSVKVVREDGSSIALSQATPQQQSALVADWIARGRSA
jgi:hypothetical protein